VTDGACSAFSYDPDPDYTRNRQVLMLWTVGLWTGIEVTGNHGKPGMPINSHRKETKMDTATNVSPKKKKKDGGQGRLQPLRRGAVKHKSIKENIHCQKPLPSKRYMKTRHSGKASHVLSVNCLESVSIICCYKYQSSNKVNNQSKTCVLLLTQQYFNAITYLVVCDYRWGMDWILG
jgi:hypothetical protein